MTACSRSMKVADGKRRYAAVMRAVKVCAACRYAETFAEHPPAYCTCANGVRAGQCVFAGQPACSHFAARPGRERARRSQRAGGAAGASPPLA